MVLADWPISLGIDARVVAGLCEGEGHPGQEKIYLRCAYEVPIAFM